MAKLLSTELKDILGKPYHDNFFSDGTKYSEILQSESQSGGGRYPRRPVSLPPELPVKSEHGLRGPEGHEVALLAR